MDALIRAFWRILLLRAAPQSIPASLALLWLVLLAHFVVGLLHALFSMPAGLAPLYALVGTLTTAVVVHGLLLLFRKHARYRQTLTALTGAEALMGLLMLPLNGLYYLTGAAALLELLVIFTLLFIGWNVAVAAHIFRHALSVSMGLGFLYSVVYLVIALTLGDMVSAAGVTR